MDIRSCLKCERAFSYDGEDLCPKCRYEDDEDFKIVKEYLYDNPGADVNKVTKETGVDLKKILRYLKEGRIEIAEGSANTLLSCERCGKAVNTGRFCKKCVAEMEKEFKGAIGEIKPEAPKQEKKDSKKADEKMHVVFRYKK
ncbi:flagellar operon protein YvyF [Gottschalkia acidurici 9a]|uniref:Flagellar operon protein YvyF n=1 Tax=Gottschalkia acidurici (strain ATCC 7906 / DSM 604 / BCRC 14475 / CIP 104303 / KCTC 5404 / NCIMB 10678 / 9a) TaxID=1128398 RepID=K0AU02_GOTA9|nr:flagellar protein [Gottschalkia acidurici]AFS77318.1 flagellar operon protein YvyF [Gottschalkia acidurici 9a]